MQFKGQLSDCSSIFFIIWKFLSPGKYKPIYKSEVIGTKSGRQSWNGFQLDMFSLCSDELEQEIKVDFFRSEQNGNHKNLGTAYFTINDLKNGQRALKAKLRNKEQIVEITKFETTRSSNFMEYVFGGCQINLNVAIDFTLSNGDPKAWDSLHCKDPKRN